MEEDSPAGKGTVPRRAGADDRVRVRRDTLQAVLEQCQRALELLKSADEVSVEERAGEGVEEEEEEEEEREERSAATAVEYETDELCDLLKSRVESPGFLAKLGGMHMSVSNNSPANDGASWDIVSTTDVWEDKHINGEDESDPDGYVFVRQEDIVEGIACFTAAYLLSLKETKELTPNQLQEALSKAFSVKKKKGKIQKAWDGGKVIYNVASWSATAIGIYQNPAIVRAATVAFWSSCRVISKLF